MRSSRSTVHGARRFRAEPDEHDMVAGDALTGRYVDMVKAGIIDPAKVTHAALEAAVSMASMLLTTEAAITEKEAEDLESAVPV